MAGEENSLRAVAAADIEIKTATLEGWPRISLCQLIAAF